MGGWIQETMQTIRQIQIRQAFMHAINFGLVLTSAMMIWKALMCITGTESPVVVVISGSMEPGFRRGDILFLHMSKDPIEIGEIVVFNIEGKPISIVHRVIKVHQQRDTGEVNILTKGDNNSPDDLGLYASGQQWLEWRHISGRAIGYVPYLGWPTIILKESYNKVHSLWVSRIVLHVVKRVNSLFVHPFY